MVSIISLFLFGRLSRLLLLGFLLGAQLFLPLALFLTSFLRGSLGSLVKDLFLVILLLFATSMITICSLFSFTLLIVFLDFDDFSSGYFLEVLRQFEHLRRGELTPGGDLFNLLLSQAKVDILRLQVCVDNLAHAV